MDLSKHAPASSRRVVDRREVLPPKIRGIATMKDAESNWYTGLYGQGFETTKIILTEIRIDISVLARNFKDAGSQVAHDANQLLDLIPVRQTASDGLPIRCLVIASA